MLPTLAELAKKHRTDKASLDSHTFFNKNYLDIYTQYLESKRSEPIRFLEIGVLYGKSLATWRDYFPNAEIHGIDINPDCKQYEVKEKNIFVHIIDCSDDSSLQEFKNKYTNYFDVILDDGSHINTITKKSFDYLYYTLKQQGLYMIEDLACAYLGNEFLSHVKHWPGTERIKNKETVNDPKIMLDLYSEVHKIVDSASTNLAKIDLNPTYAKFGFEYIHHYPQIVIMKKNEMYSILPPKINVKKPKLHLLTFADNHLSQYGLNNYTNMAQKLIEQAHEFMLFSKIHFYTAQSLFEKYPEFYKAHRDFINSNFKKNIWRGYGYWIWKPFLIWKTLCEMDEGDVLLYADSGCELHVSGIERFKEYLEIVQKNENKNLFIEHPLPIKEWCKMDTVKYFGAEKLILEDNAKEVCPTVLFTSSTEKNKVFFKLYYEACCNYHNVDDSPSQAPNIPTFKDHRHDQTIFSILVRQMYTSSMSTVLFSEVLEPNNDKSPITIRSNKG